MIGLLAFALRVLLLAGFTFGFVVLFEHGPQGFTAGVPVEANHLVNFATSLMAKKTSEPAPAPAVEPTPAPAPAPVDAPAPAPAPAAANSQKPNDPPSAWEKLQSKPIGEGMDATVGGSTN